MKRLFLFLALATTVSATPFDPKDVAADPSILVHLDCDALRASTIGKSLLADPDIQNKLSTVAALFNFDIRTQLHGFTIYTREKDPKEGVLIVYADFDADRLTLLAKSANGSLSHTNGSHVIYSWFDDKKKDADGSPKRVYGAILGPRVVFGQDESHVADALDVIDHKAPNFSGKEGLSKADAGESIVAEGVILKFPFDNMDQNAAIFRMSKSAHFKVSEVPDNLRVALNLEASDADTATQMAAIARGLVALLKLQKTDTNALELANAIQIKQDDYAVAVTLALPNTEVVDRIKQKQDAMKKAEGSHSGEKN